MNREEEGKESSWNMAKAYLQRLDQLLQEMNYYSTIGDNIGWYKSCWAFFREISPKLKESKVNDHLKTNNEIIKQMNLNIINARIGLTTIDHSNLFVKLQEWDVKLRNDLEKLGLLSPSKDDPRFAVGK